MKRYLNLIFVVATIAMNGLANALPINGKQTGEISDQIEVFFTPAGYVFSIWGLIYLLLTGFAVYQLLPGTRTSTLIDRISLPFWISCLANMSWIVLWHYEQFGVTLLVMLVLFSSLGYIWYSLNSAGPPQSTAQKLMLYLPFSVYFGWITIATLANVSVALEVYDLRPFAISVKSWAIAMIILGGLIGLAIGKIRRDIAYLAVVVWAFTGIAVKQEWSGAVAYTALGFTALVVLQIVWLVFAKNNKSVNTAI